MISRAFNFIFSLWKYFSLFYFQPFINSSFFRRLCTGLFLIMAFVFIRLGNKFQVQILFFTAFLCMLWELNKSFKIPFNLLLLGKFGIIIEFYFNISGSSPNVFLHISLFRFLLIYKSNPNFSFYFIIFMLLTLFFFSPISSLVCFFFLIWDYFFKNSKKYIFSFFVINYVLCGFIWLYNILKPNGIMFTGPVLMLLSCVVNDACAYFVGSFVGGPKLLPKISKKKTISGFLGGMIFTYLGGYLILKKLEPSSIFSLWESSNLFPIPLFYLPILATIGDLIESGIKRYFKKKDAGYLLPGHGGFFDRLDSMFFIGIVYSLLLQFSKKL